VARSPASVRRYVAPADDEYEGTPSTGSRRPIAGVLSSADSAARTPSSTSRSMAARSRKRTSAFAGWTLTSTSPSGTSRNRKSEGCTPSGMVVR
jgi:hypothetical protein